MLIINYHKYSFLFIKGNIETRKRFSEKPIDAFTNSTVFILDYIKLVWSHVLAWSALEIIPDCIKYIIGVFCYNFNHRRTFLIHINTLACVKAEI